jgi:hypothetical protein
MYMVPNYTGNIGNFPNLNIITTKTSYIFSRQRTDTNQGQASKGTTKGRQDVQTKAGKNMYKQKHASTGTNKGRQLKVQTKVGN